MGLTRRQRLGGVLNEISWALQQPEIRADQDARLVLKDAHYRVGLVLEKRKDDFLAEEVRSDVFHSS